MSLDFFLSVDGGGDPGGNFLVVASNGKWILFWLPLANVLGYREGTKIILLFFYYERKEEVILLQFIKLSSG